MPMDPSHLPPSDSGPATYDVFPAGAERGHLPVVTVEAAPLPSATPNLGHAALFVVFVVLSGLLAAIPSGIGMHWVARALHESGDKLTNDPRFLLPMEALIYAIAAGVSFLVFPRIWGRPFSQGIHWRAVHTPKRWWLLVGIGVVTSAVVQVLSNFLPIPKELPIDKLFTESIGVWLIAIFGVTIAPAFEELAFRGFLLPSLATAWDWVAQRGERARAKAASASDWDQQAATYATLPPDGASVFHRYQHAADGQESTLSSDPAWSTPALVFATVITSIGFALLHGAQLAHSIAPLGVLFVVSCVLCITRLRFHSLAASTVVHSMYNATIFVMLFIGTDGFRHLDKLGK